MRYRPGKLAGEILPILHSFARDFSSSQERFRIWHAIQEQMPSGAPDTVKVGNLTEENLQGQKPPTVSKRCPSGVPTISHTNKSPDRKLRMGAPHTCNTTNPAKMQGMPPSPP